MKTYTLFFNFFISVLFLYPCESVIYKLNESEYSRMPPVFALDEYEACLSQEQGLYCLLQLHLFDDRDNPLMDLIQEYSDNNIKHYNHSLIDRGVCVQDACRSYINNTKLTGDALTRTLGACLNESIWNEYGIQANVSILHYCDSKNDTDGITTLDWTVMGVFLTIVMVNLFASFYDYTINHHYENKQVDGNNYLLCFSFIRNYKWLTSTQDKNSKLEALQFFHFSSNPIFKVLINFLMILAHAMLIIAAGYTTNTHDFEKTYDLFFYQLIYNGLMIVQIFFFTSGFLLVYNFQIYAEDTQVTWTDIPKVMLLRCCRLSPALAVVLAFTATWLRHLGSGPLWKLYVTNSVVADCQVYWWHHLLYINNYVQEDKFCALPTWHIAADTQVYLLGLVVCVATTHRRRGLTLALLLLAGTAAPALQVWLQDLDGTMIMNPEFFRTLDSATFRKAHVVGHNNLQCFVVGMALAYLVYDWQRKGVDLSNNKYYSLIFWLSPIATALWFYTGHVFYADGARASLLMRMAYAAGHRLGIGAIAALFTIGMVLQSPSCLRSLAEWRVWTVPSRLSYSVYLLHMNQVHILLATRLQTSWVSYYNMALAHLGIVLLTYMMAFPFFLMVEAPVNRLVKLLLDTLKPKHSIAAKKNKAS